MQTSINLTDEEAREYILLMFDGYQKRKKDGKLYKHDRVPEMIIKVYYTYVNKPSFDRLLYNFKRRYLYNENKMEYVHSLEEQKGLSLAYDYVNKKNDFDNISIYDLSYIHEELYSKTQYPEFGGRYRKEDIYLVSEGDCSNTGNIELCPYWNITHEMNLLKPEVKELVDRGIALGQSCDPNQILKYISDCVILKCKLIKIHPFRDGNGRAVRVFINLLFKLANLPPVYIENKEKFKYQEAMNHALALDDYTDIINFYYYKICDSIIDLDVDAKNVIVSKVNESEDNNKISKVK